MLCRPSRSSSSSSSKKERAERPPKKTRGKKLPGVIEPRATGGATTMAGTTPATTTTTTTTTASEEKKKEKKPDSKDDEEEKPDAAGGSSVTDEKKENPGTSEEEEEEEEVQGSTVTVAPPGTGLTALTGKKKTTSVVRDRWHVIATQEENAPELNAARQELRELLLRDPRTKDSPYLKHYALDETVLRRFLTARDNDATKALALLHQSLKWRETRKPDAHDYAELEREARTGKIRVSKSLDEYGRPVVIFDNTVQNTKDPDANMRFLAFNLEHALRRMIHPVEKYVIFMHLTHFSLSNNPGWSVTKETCAMLVACFCECCGHIIIYGAPSVFRAVFAAVKPLIDPKTATKVIFVKVDDAKDDALLKDVLGENWREITGAGASRETSKSSPGYRHFDSWSTTLKDELLWRQRNAGTKILEGPLAHTLKNWPGDHPLDLDLDRVPWPSYCLPRRRQTAKGQPSKRRGQSAAASSNQASSSSSSCRDHDDDDKTPNPAAAANKTPGGGPQSNNHDEKKNAATAADERPPRGVVETAIPPRESLIHHVVHTRDNDDDDRREVAVGGAPRHGVGETDDAPERAGETTPNGNRRPIEEKTSPTPAAPAVPDTDARHGYAASALVGGGAAMTVLVAALALAWHLEVTF